MASPKNINRTLDLQSAEGIKARKTIIPADESSYPTPEQLDEDEAEFASVVRPMAQVTGAAAAGIVAISVANNPGRECWFRTHPDFHPVVDLVVRGEGEKSDKFVLVKQSMVPELAVIGMSTTPHTLYLTITDKGVLRIIPVQCADERGKRHIAHSTKELGLLQGVHMWTRLFWTGTEYRVYPDKDGRGKRAQDVPDPVFPELSIPKTTMLGFRPRGLYIDTVEQALFKEWAKD
jgi:hypothetical protein